MRVLLGVSGGIAAYKAASVASALVQRGDRVDVIMTEDAGRFIGALTFAALTRNPVLTSLWDAPESIPHIALVRAADVFAIVPATANVLAKLAHGLADDLLTNAALAATIPLLVAPAMNAAMYDHPATAANVARLVARGVAVVRPGVGFLAEREHGVGRLADPEAIVAAIDAATGTPPQALAGRRVFINAGPTREAIDPVRFLSNAATGTMGIALAREALARGASVDLVLGPTLVAPPPGARVVHVTTAQELHDASLALADGADFAVATAAVADWRPAVVHAHKVKKQDGEAILALERTPDALAAIGARKGATFLVGFAAETRDHEASARDKLERKHLDAIAVNDVGSAESGFGTGPSELTLLYGHEGRRELGRAGKAALAPAFWDAVLELAAARAEFGPGEEPVRTERN